MEFQGRNREPEEPGRPITSRSLRSSAASGSSGRPVLDFRDTTALLNDYRLMIFKK
jgi:hypothetical protein